MTDTAAFDIQKVQRNRKIALVLGVLLLVALAFLTRSISGAEGMVHETVEAVGLALIAVCIVGRAWCSLYIGGRKKAEIVQNGPYSISRNPLYVFSFLGSFGVGAQTGSVVLALLFLGVAYLVFLSVVKREEAWLFQAHGSIYENYRARTPRFGPDFTRWRDTESLSVNPSFFLRTLRDGLVFLLAVPLFESIDKVQAAGWFQTLIHLP